MARSVLASIVVCGRSLRRRAASAKEGASRIFLLCDPTRRERNGNLEDVVRQFFIFLLLEVDGRHVVADAEEECAWAGPSAVQLCARLTRARERGAGGSVWVGARVVCP